MACGGGGGGYFKLMYNSITACNPTGAKTLSVRVCDRNGFDSSGLNSCNDCAAIVKGEKPAEWYLWTGFASVIGAVRDSFSHTSGKDIDAIVYLSIELMAINAFARANDQHKAPSVTLWWLAWQRVLEYLIPINCRFHGAQGKVAQKRCCVPQIGAISFKEHFPPYRTLPHGKRFTKG